ncbi:potassium channel family protein [Bacterioplanoides sp.]|uniref:potassium channel family protein n=1 Tax=Bacterioplanoides sp. TaxID=2066072 RepID=UPI003B5C9CA8
MMAFSRSTLYLSFEAALITTVVLFISVGLPSVLAEYYRSVSDAGILQITPYLFAIGAPGALWWVVTKEGLPSLLDGDRANATLKLAVGGISGLIIGFAFIYYDLDQNKKELFDLDVAINSLYVSMVTFSTLGYGDVIQTTVTGKLFSALEGLIGNFVMALLAVKLVMATTKQENTEAS